jgi:hypothetical protein
MRKSRRASRKRGGKRSMRMCARNNVMSGMSGGNLGFSYRNGEMIIPGVVTTERFPSCGGVARPGMLSGVTPTGLPGMSGGRRHRRRSMKGGRYSVDLQAAPIITGPQGGLAPIARIGCELGGSPTASTAPPLSQMRGGAAALAPNYPDVFEQPTAGYTNKVSDFVTSTGAPIMLQIPQGGRASSCAMQGGRRRRSHKKQRKSRARKQRKSRARKQRKSRARKH